jgi:hypothetical protein
MSGDAHDGLAAKLVAGGLSCMFISAVLNPMDVVKVILQTQTTSAAGLNAYHGTWHALHSVYNEQGYRRGLMKGITASMLREATYSSLRMGLYDSIKIVIAPSGTSKDQFSLLQKLIAGAGSGAIGSFLATPTDLIKIRFQSYSPRHPNPYRNTFDAFYRIANDEHGFRGLYRGGTPTVVRAALLTSVQLSSYDQSKRALLRSNAFGDNVVTHLTASVISGLITTTIVNPVDVIKTRVMCDNASNERLYTSPVDCFRKTFVGEGSRALFKGWLANYLRIGPHCLVALPLAEFIRKALGADSF